MSSGVSVPLFTPRSGGSGGGGGGSAIEWRELANAPTLDYENNVACYFYQSALAQELYSVIKVPNSYVANSPINLRILWYSPDTSGNGLIRAQSTLIRSEVDAISSTTNQRTTTNSAATLSAGTANEPQRINLDVSSTTGTVNSVAISAGDILIIRLYRDTDTAASDLRFIIDSTEVTFA